MQGIIERDLFTAIKPYLQDKEVLAIHGARQVGKTSLLQYIMDHISRTVTDHLFSIDLEDPVYLGICNRGVEELLQYLRAKGLDIDRTLYLAIDEIQYLDNPNSFLKLFFDHYQGKVKLIVTGSSTFSIKSKFKDSLVGRILEFDLYPLNFREFLRFRNLSYDVEAPIIPDAVHEELKGHYRNFALKGGYPAIALENVTDKQEKKLKQIISTYIKTDIRDLGKVRNIQKFNHLLEILASQSGNLLNVSELAATIGIAKQTIEEYLFIMENTYVIRVLHPYFRNIRSELTKMPKIFFEDGGIVNLLVNRSFADRLDGRLFENSVFTELRKQMAADSIYFWRTNKGHEVDFILEETEGAPCTAIPVEAKLQFRKKDLTSLKYFVEKYGVAKACICTMEKTDKSPYDWLKVIYPWELHRFTGRSCIKKPSNLIPMCRMGFVHLPVAMKGERGRQHNRQQAENRWK